MEEIPTVAIRSNKRTNIQCENNSQLSVAFAHTSFLIPEPIEVIFFIRSQDAFPQNQLSQQLKENLIRQSVELQPDYRIKVQILHELFNYPGEWTILHIIPHIVSTSMPMTMPKGTSTTKSFEQIEIGMELITHLTRWIVFCEEATSVNVRLLMQRLSAENHTQVCI